MSRKIFDRYWNGRYADAPDGQPHSDPDVPFEHLQKYVGKPAMITVTGPILFSAQGSLRHDGQSLGLVWDGGDIYMAKETLGQISWDENNKYYVCKGNGFVVGIKPQE